MKKNVFISLSFIALFLASCGEVAPVSSVASDVTTAEETTAVETTTEETTKGTTEESSIEESSIVSSNTSESNSTVSSQDGGEDLELLSYWNTLDLNSYGQGMIDALLPLINKTGNMTIGYKTNNSYLTYSDSINCEGKMIIPFYHGPEDAVSGKVGSGNINKEHVWPNSRGAGESGPGADPHMLRAALSSENSSRGNKFFGFQATNTYDPASLGYEPARGECARIVFYTCARYQKSHGLSMSNNPGDSTSLKTMGRLDTLLEWNNQYPVTQQEINRNEYLYKQGFGRNPFIDHPQLVNYIWDSTSLRTSPYNGDSGGGTTPPTTYTYQRVTSVNELSEGTKVALVSNYMDDTSSYAALNDTATSDSLPWYLTSTGVNAPQNGTIETTQPLVQFTIGKDGDYYTFKTNNGYLFHYHTSYYSIGIGYTPTDNGSVNWNVTISNDKAVLKGEQNVYLVLSDKSHATWKGYSSDAAQDLGLYLLHDE